mmetsp:Transcript_32361/g.56354  ORF Transcript_32361/g.56354 Transcript_32361/m.56354 type:complete len:102 (+) Transcript_32361:417-722(+)
MRKLVVFSKVEQRKYIYAGSYRFELNEGGCPVIEDADLSHANDPAIRDRLLGKLRQSHQGGIPNPEDWVANPANWRRCRIIFTEYDHAFNEALVATKNASL